MAVKQVKLVKDRSVGKERDLEKHIVNEAKVSLSTGVDKDAKAVQWEAKQGEVHSDIKLEADMGEGKAVIVRSFDFKANPEAFHIEIPSKQQLFNAHIKQLEILLMKDGLKVMTEVAPRIMIAKDKTGYRIVVGAEPMRGHNLLERPQTLSQITNGRPEDTN